jgi:hypothetical protein
MSKNNQPSKFLPRNHLAVAARQRNGGFMKHRNAGRGGARNTQAEYLADADLDTYEDWEW